MEPFKFNLKSLSEKPFEFYHRAAKTNSIFFEKNLLAFNYVQISTYEGMRMLFRHEDLIKPKSYKKIGKAYNLEGSLINDGEIWKLARTSTQKTLLKVSEDEIKKTIDEVFNTFKSEIKSTEDILPTIRVFIQSCMNLIFFDTFNWDLNSKISGRVRELEEIMFSQQFSAIFQIFGTNYYFSKTKYKRRELEDIFYNHFKNLKNTSRFINWLNEIKNLDVHKDFVFNEIFNFWVAANEATSNTICWALYILTEELKETPSSMLSDELINQSLQEAQRFFPAAYFIAREAKKDIDFKGRTIKKGSIINFSTYMMNRDPKHFLEPNKLTTKTKYKELKSNRPPYSFGHGKRICSGKSIAETLMPYFIKKLTKHFNLNSIGHTPEPLAHVSLSSKNGFKFQIESKLNRDTDSTLNHHKLS